jgi:uncharacterized membrane protein
MAREKSALILIAALAIALRFYDVTYQSLWGDEAFSIYAAKCVDMHFMTASLVDATHRKFFNQDKTPRDLFTACIRNEGAPPAYYVALAIWIRAFGSSDFDVRSLSVLLGALSVPALFLLGLRLFKRPGTALIAALFIAVSPLNIYFSQEVRAYILANLLALLSCWLFLRAVAEGSRSGAWAAYGLASLTLCYSFYFAALVLLAHFIYLLIHERRMLRPWFVTMAVVGLLFLPWCLIGLRTQLYVTSAYAPPGPASTRALLLTSAEQVRYILDSLILGPLYSRVIIGDNAKLVIELGLLLLLTVGGIRLWRAGERRTVTFSLLILFVPLAIISGYGLLKGTLWYMKPRYHMWEASGIFLLAAASVTTFRRTEVRATIICAFCTFSLLAAPYHFYPQLYNSGHAKPDFRAAAETITRGQERGDIIIVNIAGHMIPFNIYYKGGLRQIGLAETGCYDLIEKLDEYTRKRRRVWLLVGHGTRGHGDREITAFLDGRFPIKKVYDLQGLTLIHYSRNAPERENQPK